MNRRTLASLLLAVGLVLPAVGAAAPTQANSPTGAASGPVQAVDAAAQAGNDTNYTRLYVDDRYQNLRLKPGESDTFTVAVENGEDHSVTLSPHVFVPPRGERPVEKSWVSIAADDPTLDAGEEREFEVTVSVPEDAELNRYGGMVALTDETVTYPGRPERPVHGVSLNVEVWKEPTVRILTDQHVYTQVEAGESFTRTFVVENTGDSAVPVNPQVRTEQQRRVFDDRQTLDRSWVSIDAPTEIESGQTETISVTVTPPEDVNRGDYSTEIDLGLKDPARPDRSSYWQRVDVRFQVWTQPENPYETDFEVDEGTESVTLDLSAHHRPRDGNGEAASFDVTFVSPNGTEVDAERVETTTRGSVDLGENNRQPGAEDSTYAAGSEQQTFRYRVDDPEAGSWSVKIMPHDAMRFSYEITRDESE